MSVGVRRARVNRATVAGMTAQLNHERGSLVLVVRVPSRAFADWNLCRDNDRRSSVDDVNNAVCKTRFGCDMQMHVLTMYLTA